ncbi:MAG: P-II family nitrogen regulator [Deltaproteobacteria bacterium]|nr:P-II family nitrogen regulator [Deltaproteobacteria bacterium]
MKKIEAIIRPERLAAVRGVLEELGYPGMTLSEVRGYGKQGGQTQQWRGVKYEIEFQPKLKIEIVVIDEDALKTVQAIVRTARTGETGDGKIFIIPVEGAVRIRTGDRDNNAV